MESVSIRYCKICNRLFTPAWPDQDNCTDCQPLKCDPAKIELIRDVAKKVWSRAA